MAEHTPTLYKWHPKFDANERNGSIYSEQRPGHAYAVAMQPRYVENDQWSKDAAFIVKAVNSHDALVKALEAVRSTYCEIPGGPQLPIVIEIAGIVDAALSALCEQDRVGGEL